MLLLETELVPLEELRKREANHLFFVGEPTRTHQVLHLLRQTVGNFECKGLHGEYLHCHLSSSLRARRQAMWAPGNDPERTEIVLRPKLPIQCLVLPV